MFSQWATKRICKFFMKRLLGRMLRSELDLEQLEVQLGFGTIQLKELFLNTEYLNDQLGDASVAIKEGSIGSVRARIPWKVLTAESCEIEVDELKLVIVPRFSSEDDDGNNYRASVSDNLSVVDTPQYSAGDVDASGLGSPGGGAYVGVDDGVRMIAKMVERVLLGLRVKVTNMIIVFEEINDRLSGDVGIEKTIEQSMDPHSLLIARVRYIEYGVEAPYHDLEESANTTNGTEPSMLVKVVKFRGATLEVVDVQDEMMELGEATDERSALKVPCMQFIGQPTFLLFGESGGFSGSIQLSVPWKDGTIDVPKVHADFAVGPIKLQVSPHQTVQMLNLLRAFSRGGGLGDAGFPVAPAPQSSALQGSSLANVVTFRDHNVISGEKNNEVLRTSSVSTSGTGVRGVEANSSNTVFLPVTRFISDWMLWAGSEGQQRKDGSEAEADLAASVDEFFECFDGTRSSQAGYSSTGMWNWTRSAFSAITAASSLAAGSIVLHPDLPKQPEYSMKARLMRISLDLFYDSTVMQKHSLVPTLASELYPLKEVSAKQASVCVSHSVQDTTYVEQGTGEHLKAEFCELNLTLMVSECQTQLSATIKDLDVSELVLKEVPDKVHTSGRPSRHSHVQDAVSPSELLQSCIEKILPAFPAALAPSEHRVGSSEDTTVNPGKSLEQGSMARQPLGQTITSSKNYEKKQLLRVLSAPDYAAQVTVTWQPSVLVTGVHSGRTEVVAFLEPVVLWLDVHTLKRIELMLQKSKGPASEKFTATKFDDCSKSSNAPVRIKQEQDLSVHDKVAAIVERVAFHVKIFAPCLRTIICFPIGPGLGCDCLQKDFVALDINAPVANLGIVKPILNFKHLGGTAFTSPLSGDTLLLHVGDVAANLISSIPESHTEVKGFAFTTDEILLLSQQDLAWESPTLDRQTGSSVEVQWHSDAEIGPWIAKRAWDGVAAQQRQGDGGRGIGGSNSEFAAATTAAEAVEEENSQLRKELLSGSSCVVHVNVPQIKLRASEFQYTRVLELIGWFIKALVHRDEEASAEPPLDEPDLLQPLATSDRTPLGVHQSHPSQTSIFVQCGQVDIALCLKEQHILPGIGAKEWDLIRLNVEKLQVLLVHGIGGSATSFYVWVHHEDIGISGSPLFDYPTVQCREAEMLLLSCKSEALGRGDGGGGNALAAAKAGFTITYMVWPGQEELGDALLTGTIRGITIVAHSGRLDWVSAVTMFFNSTDQMESLEETTVESFIEDKIDTDPAHDPTFASAILRTYLLLDLHDVALCYEPGSEAMLVPGVRAGRVSSRRGAASSAESSQVLAPVACVLAAAAVRVSSSVIPRETGEQYDIWLRDVALHLLDTALRKQTSFDYTTESLHRAGYVQIAKEAVMEALVRIDGGDGLQWEVECANNQLRFDTCHDTTAALGRLIAQLQQLFTPEYEHQTLNVSAWKADAKGSGGGLSSGNHRREDDTGDMQNTGDASEVSSIDLFEGVLEDAFSRVRSSWSSSVGDYDVDELQGETYTVINAPLHSRVSSMDRHEFLDRGRSDLPGSFKKSLPTAPTQMQRPKSSPAADESVIVSNSGGPTFIEDYYVTTQKHASHPLGIMLSRQIGESPQQTSGLPKHTTRESASSGSGGREAEGKGGWYAGKGLEVVEDHVPEERACVELGQPSHGSTQVHESQSHNRKLSLPKKYPASVGRVVLRDLSAKWRFYGGSDWPTGRVGQDCKSSSPTTSEESGRQTGVCLEVLLDGMELQYNSFPAVGLYASRLVVSIRDIGVYDCSTDAPWRMVLGYHRSKSRPRESSSQAVKIEMDAVRPDPSAPLEEYRLSIGLLPIRLHLDQRHVDFCIEFFSPREPCTTGGVASDEGTHPLASATLVGNFEAPSNTNDLVEEALLPFFQICEMRPFTIRVDYLPRRIDLVSLRGGNYAELLNLVTWKGIELNLKHVRAAGVHGWSSLSGVIFGEWLEDISQNQVHKFVRGVGPIRPLYAVGSGAAKLVVLPAEYYKKDRRLFRGMRKGAIAFLRSISLEALGLGAHLAAGAHEILQQTELALGGTLNPTSCTSGKGDRRSRKVQPGDTREGLQQACESISQGLERATSSVLGNPLKVYQRGAGAGSAVASALRATPAAAVAPASAAAGAVYCALLGVRNELDPEKKRESDEKHIGPPPDSRKVR